MKKCPYWADENHCFAEKYIRVGGTLRVVKDCLCGLRNWPKKRPGWWTGK